MYEIKRASIDNTHATAVKCLHLHNFTLFGFVQYCYAVILSWFGFSRVLIYSTINNTLRQRTSSGCTLHKHRGNHVTLCYRVIIDLDSDNCALSSREMHAPFLLIFHGRTCRPLVVCAALSPSGMQRCSSQSTGQRRMTNDVMDDDKQ